MLNLMPSSNIENATYDGTDLIVEFKGGQQYIYFNVPESVVFGWEIAESAGKYHNTHIKGCYEYKRLEEVEEVV